MVGLGLIAVLLSRPGLAQVRLVDEFDRAAFRAWFVWLADAQFTRPTPDVTDCAALVRHAVREALRPHNAEWIRLHAPLAAPTFPDVRKPPPVRGEAWPLFRTLGGTLAEFADAQAIVRYNARPVGRDVEAARPGDLLYFHQDSRQSPDHLMVFVGPSSFDAERAGNDWIVYHTGPSTTLRAGPSTTLRAGPDDEGAGEVRKVRVATLLRHPAPRWRPRRENRSFVGVFRLAILESGSSW